MLLGIIAAECQREVKSQQIYFSCDQFSSYGMMYRPNKKIDFK